MSVGKIILKSTTRMSLNDRFTVLRQEKPTGQGQHAAGLEERRQHTHASRRNQRLAAQMERRPAVLAALMLDKTQQKKNESFAHKRVDQRLQRSQNIKQRLAVKGRLTLPNENIRRTANLRGRGGIRGLRGATGNFRGISSRGAGFRGGRGFLSSKGGGNLSRSGNISRGTRGGIRNNTRGGRGGRFVSGGRGGIQGRGGARGGLRGSAMTGQGRGGVRRTRGRGRGGRTNRGGRGSRGASGMQNGGNFTREQLDQQLDEYMSKTKHTVGDDLVQYMNDV